MRKILITCVFLTGCASSTKDWNSRDIVSIYNNPIYGELNTDDPRYLNDVRDCELKVYKDGVTIDGKKIYERKELIKIETEHEFNFIRKETIKYRETPAESEITKAAKEYADNTPDYIKEIRRLRKMHIKCMRVDKQYTLIKAETYDTKTGKLLFTTKF